MKRTLVILLSLGVVFAAASLIWQRHSAQAERQVAFEKAKAERAAELERLRQERRALAPIVLPVPEPDTAKTGPKAKPPTAPIEPSSQVNSTNRLSLDAAQPSAVVPPMRTWQDPLARMALSFVGDDDIA